MVDSLCLGPEVVIWEHLWALKAKHMLRSYMGPLGGMPRGPVKATRSSHIPTPLNVLNFQWLRCLVFVTPSV